MRTVILGPRTPEIDALIARRHALGQDHLDEVWHGEYHMAPAPNQRHGETVASLMFALHQAAERAGLIFTDSFNLGEPDDYRVPDLGLHRESGDADWVPTAALVAEVVSPDDESWLKFGHYAAHAVDEVVIADPRQRTLAWFVLGADGTYASVERSPLLGLDVADVVAALGWGRGDVVESRA
jgi:Uma2 family endonuclease